MDLITTASFRSYCTGCGHSMMVQRADLALNPEQRASRAYRVGYCMCGRCYGRAATRGAPPHPAPGRLRMPPGAGRRVSSNVDKSDATRHLKQAGFAQTPKWCHHTNGEDEQQTFRLNPHRRYTTLTLKRECRDCGHTLGPTALVVGEWIPHLGSRTYTCRVCQEIDPYIAVWRPAGQPRRLLPERTTTAPGYNAVRWLDGEVHVINDTWSNMTIPLHIRCGISS